MKYFVTGATGFVGGHVARHLRLAGHDVVALVRDPERADALVALGVKPIPGDVTDRESMRAPMTGVDGVFHIAGWYKIGVKDKAPGVPVNVEGTRNVLGLMKELKIPRGVYMSTLAVNSDTRGKRVDETYRFGGRHLSEYDRTKAAAHDIAQNLIRDGLPLVIVQPGLIYGPGDTGPAHEVLRDFLRRRLPPIPQRTAFCWAHVDDVARAHLLAMERGRAGESYFTCGPVHTLAEAIHLAEETSGVPAPRLTAPPWMLKGVSGLMSIVERVLPVPTNWSGEYLRVIAGTTYIGSNAKARRELSWVPRPLKEGLAETVLGEMKVLGM